MWRLLSNSWFAYSPIAPAGPLDLFPGPDGTVASPSPLPLPATQAPSPCAGLHPQVPGKRIERLGKHVYCAVGYALSNVTMVAVDGGKVIIDATESVQAGREIKAAFDRLVPGPVKML